MNNIDQLRLAQTIARAAHTGQTDKTGAPYINHPRRVAETLAGGREDLQAAAWLHDVLEDTDITAQQLRDAGINEHIIGIVEALSINPGETRDAYYQRIKAAGPDAIAVKLADIADNSDENRLGQLDEKTAMRLRNKYAKAVAALTD